MASKVALFRPLIRKYSSEYDNYKWHPLWKDHGNIEKSQKMWKNLSLFVALPTCLLTMIVTHINHKEEEAHAVRPEYIPWEHMQIITKPFPWGDGKHSFFHNPQRNPIPGVGYEEDFKPHH